MQDDEFLSRLIETLRELTVAARERRYGTLAYLIDAALLEAEGTLHPFPQKSDDD